MTDEYLYNKMINKINRGIYTFRSLNKFEWKEKAEKMFIKELEDGTISKPALGALLQYESDQIAAAKTSLDKLPELVRKLLEEKMEI